MDLQTALSSAFNLGAPVPTVPGSGNGGNFPNKEEAPPQEPLLPEEKEAE